MKKFVCFTFVVLVMMVSPGWAQTTSHKINTEIPTDHLELWLKSDEGVVLNGSTVSKWMDQSGNGNDALQKNVNRQPVLVENGLNGKPVLSFDGVDDRLGFTGSSLISQMTLFFVYKLKLSTPPIFILTFGPANNSEQRFAFNMRGRPNNNNDNDMIIGRADNVNLVIASIPDVVKYDEWRNISITRDQTVHSINVWWNNQMAAITPEGSNVSSSFSLGDSTASWGGIGSTDNYIPFGTVRAQCEIAELIVYDTLLSNEDRLLVENYLKVKYDPTVGVDEADDSNIPVSFTLNQNYPNPFNPTTNIGFRISNYGFVSLKVFDVLGREVATLVNEEKPAGSYEVTFDASQLSSGGYMYRLSSGSFIETKKMTIIK